MGGVETKGNFVSRVSHRHISKIIIYIAGDTNTEVIYGNCVRQIWLDRARAEAYARAYPETDFEGNSYIPIPSLLKEYEQGIKIK